MHSYWAPFGSKRPVVAACVPLGHCHGNMQQYVEYSIEEDEGGTHLDETQGLGHLFSEGRHQVFQVLRERASVRVDVRRQTQAKGLGERLEGLLLALGCRTIEHALEHVGHSTLRNMLEVDGLEFESLGEEIHTVRNPILHTAEVVASFVDDGDLCAC
jgi:hypothetical protein